MNYIDLPFPFNKAFEKGANIDYKSTGRDHKYVKEHGYEPVMASDCSYYASGLKGFSLSSYGDWGTFYVHNASDKEKQMFLDMVDKHIITLWRIRVYVDGVSYNYENDEWKKYENSEWKETDCPL